MAPDGTLMSRAEQRPGDTWDLSPLFTGADEWEALFARVERDSARYAEFRGRLGESPATLAAALEFDLALSRDAERIYTFAHLKSDEDKTDQTALALYERASALFTRLSELSSFMTPELQAIPDNAMRALMDDPLLAGYRFFLEKIIRFKPHTLSQEIEEVLAMSGEMAHAPRQFFGQLDNADLRFGVITDESGAQVELTHGNFSSFLMKRDRELRRRAFFQYYKTYEEHKHAIAAALAASCKKDRFYARVRRFGSCREASLFSDNVPPSVYDNLLGAVKENLGPLFTYLRFRRERLGIDELHFYDTYVPLVDGVDFRMPYEEAVDTCAAALAPLGTEYVDTLRAGLLERRWVDRYENRGKRSGAYSSGCYDSPPYILMNYREDNINSLYTLIHEAGHSMHTHSSARHQPYVYHEYTIFVAEVASTFNEVLLSRHLLERYRDDPAMRAYILNREIDDIRGTLFRQTMFAEFEKRTHELVERDQPLTLDAFTGIYRELLSAYFGDTLVVDDALALECLRIPHFYSAFYVYKYATGISAAIALAETVLAEGARARDRYLDFLKTGGSMFPLDELRGAGVDMETPGPVRDAIAHFGRLVGELRAALG
ncbi:MAG TPA: oligoendopeptidase F [Spirochaetota bacterium]|nr:oligoendopeptidase F [Spirochaetota bacterium]HPI21774.1 oligoendopeptidase F [Spirochaetota bacterium]HPU88134.1 oligoendopeptidase F [Spirochaetota bacterium]